MLTEEISMGGGDEDGLRARSTRDAEEAFIEMWVAGPSRTRWEELPVQPGDPAPTATLLDHEGVPCDLADAWRDGPALVVFWRHWGCGCGIDRAERFRAELDSYEEAGATVVVVGQGDPVRAAAYRDQQDLGVRVLCDPDRALYQAYGLRDFSVPQLLFDAPEEFWTHDRALGEEFQRQRREGGRPLVDSPWQIPGEFVVDADGVIRHGHRYQHCEDFPDPRVLTTAIHLASSREAGRRGPAVSPAPPSRGRAR